jgi:hypothetical protein
VLVLLFLDETQLADELAAGTLACPACPEAGRLRPWGHARPRRVRLLDGQRVRLSPRRVRCGKCRVTHVCLPGWCAPRRSVDIATIGLGLAGKLLGHTHRSITAELGIPPDTVRGWLRRLTGRAEALRCHALDRLATIDPLRAPPDRPGSPLAEALDALATVAEAARRRLGAGLGLVWSLLGQFGVPAPGPGARKLSAPDRAGHPCARIPVPAHAQ